MLIALGKARTTVVNTTEIRMLERSDANITPKAVIAITWKDGDTDHIYYEDYSELGNDWNEIITAVQRQK